MTTPQTPADKIAAIAHYLHRLKQADLDRVYQSVALLYKTRQDKQQQRRQRFDPPKN
ncbi:MAG: hypothetical protein KME20_26075 [Kaiparowitsia implicata GSE-PSE-MK54-09C]|nr:hypothetical protein [Kaiparowitsia implicata GSE-PSE-MK54-09C]